MKRSDRGADDHERAAAAPLGRGLVGDGPDDGLNDEAGDRTCDPDEGGAALGEAQIEEVWRAVYKKPKDM